CPDFDDSCDWNRGSSVVALRSWRRSDARLLWVPLCEPAREAASSFWAFFTALKCWGAAKAGTAKANAAITSFFTVCSRFEPQKRGGRGLSRRRARGG